jgi:hypothetical protein
MQSVPGPSALTLTTGRLKKLRKLHIENITYSSASKLHRMGWHSSMDLDMHSKGKLIKFVIVWGATVVQSV